MANPSSANGLYNAGTIVTPHRYPQCGLSIHQLDRPAANPNNASTTVTMECRRTL